MEPINRMGRPQRGRPRKRRFTPPELKTDDIDGICLVARAEGKACITLLECAGAICREIGRFCVREYPYQDDGKTPA